MIQVEQGKNKNTKLWIHTNNLAERVDLNSKKISRNIIQRL